jgi:hypothetical protein
LRNHVLQDAIDFNILITRATESIQRFSDGTVFAPGGITGLVSPPSIVCGSPITNSKDSSA